MRTEELDVMPSNEIDLESLAVGEDISGSCCCCCCCVTIVIE